jgi:hypothetical protein
VVVDRGMAFADNLHQIQARGYHYLVASRPEERNDHLDDFEAEAGWQAVVREPSPTNPGQRKTRVVVKRKVVGDEVHILCKSDGREAKDQAIREKHEQRLLGDLRKLQRRVATGKLKDPTKVHEAIGRLKERYPRVARYYALGFDAATASVTWAENREKKAVATRLDGGYLLKTDRQRPRFAARPLVLLACTHRSLRASRRVVMGPCAGLHSCRILLTGIAAGPTTTSVSPLTGSPQPRTMLLDGIGLTIATSASASRHHRRHCSRRRISSPVSSRQWARKRLPMLLGVNGSTIPPKDREIRSPK